MNNYFRNITEILNLQPYKYLNTININEAVSKFNKHPDAFKANF